MSDRQEARPGSLAPRNLPLHPECLARGTDSVPHQADGPSVHKTYTCTSYIEAAVPPVPVLGLLPRHLHSLLSEEASGT